MKYKSVEKYIIELIHNGSLNSGEKIQSIRRLSEEFNCSRSTIIRAYKELEDKHYIYSIAKSGYYVVEHQDNQDSNKENFDFLSAVPDTELIPYKDFQHCMNTAIRSYKKELFAYYNIEGLYSLKEQLKKYLQDFQIFTNTQNIHITTGAQQAINILLNMEFPNDRKNILVEQPTYHGAMEIVKNNKNKVFGIDVTKKIDLFLLEEIFKNHDIKIFYLMTRFQNPTGHSYSEHEKKYIVSLLNKYDVYLIEDDYLGDLDFNNKSHTFYYYDNSNRVIYVKSFSKIYMPGLRIGCAVMPKSLGEKFKNLKFTHDFNSPILSQGALEIYMKNGMFSKHLKKLKLLYQKKIKILLFYCNKYLGRNIRYSVPNNGFFITIYLPVSVDSTQITNTLNANNVHVKDCKDMYLNFNNQYNSIRLCASSIKIDKIEKGIKLIAQTVENMKIN